MNKHIPFGRQRVLQTCAIALFLAILGGAAPARAQFLGYTSPQTVNFKALNAVTAAATAVVPNTGQSIHYLTFSLSQLVVGCQIQARIDASNDGANFFPISEDVFNVVEPASFLSPANQQGVYAAGYFPVVRVNLALYRGCAPATITVFYSGTSTSLGPPAGIFSGSPSFRRTAFLNQATPDSVQQGFLVNSPTGSSGGKIYIGWNAGAAGATTFSLSGENNINGSGQAVSITSAIALSNSAGTQVFDLPGFNVTNITVSVLCVGAGCPGNAGLNAYIVFDPVSTKNVGYSEIASNASTQLKTGPGFLQSITVNAPGTTWTLQVFDNTSCALSTIAGGTAFTIPAAGTNLLYGVNFTAGLCVKTAGGAPAGSITVAFR